MNSELLTQILLLFISLIGILMTYVLIPYLKAKTSEAQQKQIVEWVTWAVQMAEQTMVGAGTDKKAYVLAMLHTKGINLTGEELNVLIESAVYELNKAKAEVLAEPIK